MARYRVTSMPWPELRAIRVTCCPRIEVCCGAQIDLQAQARVHRIGQRNQVLVLRLQTVGSIEEHICSVADAKKGLADLTITGVPAVEVHHVPTGDAACIGPSCTALSPFLALCAVLWVLATAIPEADHACSSCAGRSVGVAVLTGGFFDGSDQASPEQRRAFLMDVLQSSAARQPADSAEEQALTDEQVVWHVDAAAS